MGSTIDTIDTIYSNDFKIEMFIKHRLGEPIPEDMKYPGWKGGGYPIHYWIKYRPGEPIPDEMKFAGW